MRPRRSPPPPPLTAAEQRALASFFAGRLPAGQLHAELLRARSEPQVPAALPADASALASALRAA